MSRSQGMKLALVLLAAVGCQGNSAEPTAAGSSSAVVAPSAPPALQLTGCAVAEPRPSHMRSGFPSVEDIGIPGPDVGNVGRDVRRAIS